jgi:hypothetical protein
MKRIAVIASGWHFPLSFYQAIANQKLPEGWSMDLFCISHRDPSYALDEKKDHTFADDLRGRLDQKLYNKVATVDDIKLNGWTYELFPNTIGDFGNTNQWFGAYGDKAKEYDLYVVTHDDNLIIHDRIFADQIEDPNFKKWGVLTNSSGMPFGNLRGSFEIFKPSVLKKMGWKFDLSMVTLTREGQTSAGTGRAELDDWNNTVPPLMDFIRKNKVKVAMLSPAYRVSAYVIEGERGYISCTHGQNTHYEDQGLQYLSDNKII